MYGIKKIFATRLTDIDTTDKEGVGTIRIEGNKVYKYVWIRNHTATVAGANGSMVGYWADGYDIHKVCVDLSDADTPVLAAGMLLATVTGTLDTSYYGWIQVAGAATVDTTLGGSAAAGHPLTLSTTDKTLTKALESDSAAVYKMICAYTQDATNKQVILACPW